MNTNDAIFLVTKTNNDGNTEQFACTPECLSMYIEDVNYSKNKITIEKIMINPEFAKQSYTSEEPYLSVA